MFKAMLKFIRSIVKGVMDLRESTEELSGTRSVSEDTVQMIKEFESYRENAYLDAANKWTIGYGNTYYQDGTPVKKGDVVTKSEGEALFRNVLQEFANDVNDMVKVDLNDCQFGAIVSLSYNIGVDAFKRSTLLRKLNTDPNDPSIANEFSRWVRAGGKTLNGLVKRRRKESEFYFSENC